jgi:hypothetical protein
MGNRSTSTVESVQAMLLSGMNGELRPGDTIGMWTFNESLMTGHFPLQLWHADASQTITARAGDFLKKQTYEKNTHFDSVMPTVNHLVTNSDILTVILLTDGDDQIKGTPFDKPINATIKKSYRHQKKIRAPFMVVLRSMAGKITDYSVTLPPWLASFPPLPPAAEIVLKEEPPPAPTPEAVVPSIILSGKPSDATTNEPVPFTPPAQVVPPITLTPEPVATLTPEPAPTATQTVETASEAVTPPPPENVTAQTTPQIPDAAPVAVVATPPHPEALAPAPTPEISAKPLEAPVVAQAPAEQAPVVAIADTKENVSSASTVGTQTAAAVIPTAPTPEVPAPIQNAVVTVPATNSGTSTKLLMGIGLVVIALGIGIFLFRGSRPDSQGSLITRSIDSDKRDS